jgi:hypothetical protein
MGFDPLSITCLSYNTRQPDEARWGPWTLGVKARTIGLFSWPGHRIYHVISEVIRAMARSAIETVTRPMGHGAIASVGVQRKQRLVSTARGW